MSRPRTVTNDSDENMELAVGLTEGMGAPERAMTSSATTGSGLLKETPIDMQQEHYGLPQTKTVVLTQTDYVSMISGSTQASPTYFQLRLNTPQDWFVTTGIATPVPSSGYAVGLYGYILPTGTAVAWPASLTPFPNTLSTTERPQWRAWWEKQYQYYTVLGVEVEVTFMNPSTTPGADAVIMNFTDSFSANNSTNVHPLDGTVPQMEQWPDVNFQRVKSSGDNNLSNAYSVVKKFYRPGQNKASVENDEDIKTWTKVGSLPSLTETMTFMVAKAWDNAASQRVGVNVRMDMRWIVQYKDLWPAFNWPAQQTTITQTAPTDILYTQ